MKRMILLVALSVLALPGSAMAHTLGMGHARLTAEVKMADWAYAQEEAFDFVSGFNVRRSDCTRFTQHQVACTGTAQFTTDYGYEYDDGTENAYCAARVTVTLPRYSYRPRARVSGARCF